MKFSQRIKFIYDLIPTKVVWDICCDHSQLALINLFEKKLDTVYCVDKSKDSLEKIKSHSVYELLTQSDKSLPGYLKLKKENLKSSDSIVLIVKDGCDLDWPQVHGCVVIAGVGTHTALSIVASCTLDKRKELIWILNPFNYEDKFKMGINQLLTNFSLTEYDFTEDGRNRKIFYFSPAT